ncbi:MAG TPA: histidine--tRNA ligase, partial [Gammaproteobacteria bacterium]|nr:histidine--tRNA ligase [Gammaproteobacteria bacterium]
FARSIGEVTDIVEKEMYTFLDRNDESITVRPEGTAGVVRACVEHALLRNQQQQRVWYMGPMCRYERPQKGRFRQFTQLGVEAFNLPGPDIDVELLAMCARLWKMLRVDHLITLQINSIGDLQSRNNYKQDLLVYLNKHVNHLDEDSKRRLHSNPLRILDSKNPDMQTLIANAPILLDYIDDEAKQHFAQLQVELTELGIDFTINPRLVRGLDYYNRTVFEWVTDKLGSQSAVCAGGRYDTLVETLGGPSVPAVGFAMGLERILLLLEAANLEFTNTVDGFLMCIGEEAERARLLAAERIRNLVPNFSLLTSMGSGNFSNLFKKADKSGAKVALIIGADEVANDTVSIKFLRSDRPQQTIALEEIHTILGDI